MNNQKVPGTFLQNNEMVRDVPTKRVSPQKTFLIQKGTRYLLVILCFLFLSCAAKEPPVARPQPATEIPPQLQTVWNNPTLLWQEAQKLLERGEAHLAYQACERILQAFPKSEVYGSAKKLSENLRLTLGLGGTRVGVLLPLTGPYARFGEAVLNGISCALGLFEPCPALELQTPVQIIVKNSQGSPTVAAQAALDLIEKEKVSVILGPLLSLEMESAARIAADHQIPILTLAPKKRTTLFNPFLFQHSLIPEEEVLAIVKQVAKQGIRKFILFYPQDRYGEEYHTLFKELLRKEGRGKIVAEASYATDLPDFAGNLQRLLGPSGENRRGGNPKPTGLFIPDSFRRVAKIAEALESLAPENIQLIGTSRWHHPRLLNHDFQALEGALIDTPFNVESPRQAAQHFQDHFDRAFGSKPAWLEAIGFDALRLIAEALRAKGTDTPPDLRDGLAAIENFPAVVGPLSWNRDGTSAWPIEFVVIRDGKFVAENQ